MNRRYALLFAVTFVLAVTFVGCGPAHAYAAATRSTSQFIPSPSDPRVFYEPGAEVMAGEVAAAMPAAVATVEERMFGPFAIPVRVYVCATIATLTSYGASARAGGFTTNHRVFISPKPENTAERIPRVVAHELSHLHLSQKLGLLGFSSLPVWFKEGLAVEVSGGGGAEGVTEADARQAIAAGHTLVPEAEGSVWHHHGAAAAGLNEHMFYRQAGMFVGSMRTIDQGRFKILIAGVENGDSLASTFEGAYRMTIDTAWQRFKADRAAPPGPP